MKFVRIVGAGALMLSLVASSAFAEKTKAEQRAEVDKVTSASLEKFYAAKPELKAMAAKAPGYGVFTTYGFSFVFGGAGGHGVVHDNKTKKNTYMEMASGSVGAQIGASESQVLMIFKNAKAMNDFVEHGWTAGGGAKAAVGADGKTAGGGMGGTMMDNADSFTLTKNGLEAGVAVSGSKYWKDKDLN